MVCPYQEISTYHTLTVDEQALLAHYIKQYHIPGEKLTTFYRRNTRYG